MSTYVILDINELANLLTELWADNARLQAEQQRREEELERQKERRRWEQDRLKQLEHKQKEAEKAQTEAYEAALAAIEARYGKDQTERTKVTECYERKRAEIRKKAVTIRKAAAEMGAIYLADFTNHHKDPVRYERIGEIKTGILDLADEMISSSGMISEFDAESRFAALVRQAENLEKLFVELQQLLEGADEASASDWQYLVSELLDGTKAAALSVETLPEDLTGAAAVRFALDTVRYYLLSPEAFYLDESEKREIRRLYSVTAGNELEQIAEQDAKTLVRLNEQFRAAKQRGFDRAIFERRQALQKVEERYLTMYETIHGTLNGSLELIGLDATSQIEILTAEIAGMEKRYLRIMRRRLAEDTMERALLKSRQGLTIRRLGAEDTESGNHKTLYQVGDSGTAIEIYTDAKGQILIEAGGIVEDADITSSQRDTIERNNAYFCNHDLPAILDAFDAELKEADLEGEVKLRREPQEDSIHVFTLDEYSKADAGALVIEADGTLRREAATEIRRALEMGGE